MENHAFVEHAIGSLNSHRAVSLKAIQDTIRRACEGLDVVKTVQRSHRTELGMAGTYGTHLSLTLRDDTVGEIMVEVTPWHFVSETTEFSIDTATTGEPFWEDMNYTSLRFRTKRFAQGYSPDLLNVAREFVVHLAAFLEGELWPEPGVARAVNQNFDRLG
jgi:hypothetical protein